MFHLVGHGITRTEKKAEEKRDKERRKEGVYTDYLDRLPEEDSSWPLGGGCNTAWAATTGPSSIENFSRYLVENSLKYAFVKVLWADQVPALRTW